MAAAAVLASFAAAARAPSPPEACLERHEGGRAACIEAAAGVSTHDLILVDPTGELTWRVALGARDASVLETWPERLRAAGETALAAGAARRLGGLAPAAEPSATPLRASDWSPRVPDLTVSLYSGDELAFDELRGRVVLLEFWATWCPPCRESLPAAEGLHRAYADDGLVTLGIGHEPIEIALPWAESIGVVEMPLGRYHPGMEEAFKVSVLPSAILVDRAGRLRARWDGEAQSANQAEEIERMVQALLAEPEEGKLVELAAPWVADELVESDWSRQLLGRIEGLAAIPTGESAPPRLLVVAGSSIYPLSADGDADERVDGSPLAGRIELADLDGDGRPTPYGYRRGAPRVVALGLDGEHEAFEAPSPVLDLAVRPAARGGAGELWLGTLDGLHRAAPDGSPLGRVDLGRPGEVLSVARDRSDGALWALLPDGVLCRLGQDEPAASCHELGGSDGWLLATGPQLSGVVVAPTLVADLAFCHLGPREPRLAIATTDERLLLVDPADGRVTFHARWPRLARVAAADLDGDGADELYVGSGRRVTVLRRRAARP